MKIQATPRLLTVLIFPLALLITGLLNIHLMVAGLLADLALILIALVDIINTPSSVKLKIETHIPTICSIGRKNSFRITVSNPLKTSVKALTRFDLPADWNDHSEEKTVEIAPGTAYTFSCPLQPMRRGKYEIMNLNVAITSPMGLFRIIKTLPQNKLAEVFPDIINLNQYLTLARNNTLAHAGFHRSTRSGNGTELDFLRDYTRDDEFRRIDWKASTRLNRPITKVFQHDTSGSVLFVIDRGRLMTTETDGLSMLDTAVNSVLLLANVAIRTGDSIGIVTFSDTVKDVLPFTKGKSGLRTASRFLTGIQAESVESNYDLLFRYLRSSIKKRCLMIFISDIVDAINYSLFKSHIAFLNKRHLTLLLLLRDKVLEHTADRDTSDLEALYESAAAKEMLLQRRTLIKKFKSSGIPCLDLLPAEVSPRLMEKYMEIKARNLL